LILRQLTAIGGADSALLYLLDEDGRRYRLVASQGVVPSKPESLPAEPALERLARSSPPDWVPIGATTAGDLLLPRSVEGLVPLCWEGRLLGLSFMGFAAAPVEWTESQQAQLRLSGHCASLALTHLLTREESRRARHLARRSDRMRSVEVMAAGFAHEIRNPLTSIKTFITLAPERREDAEFMDRFSRVAADDVGRIERLIKEILDYAKSAEPAFMPEDVNEVVAASLRFLELTATDQRLSLAYELADDLPAVTMDRYQIQQVLMNLAINAVEAMTGRPGRLRVTTRLHKKHGAEAWIQIALSDTGCGIAAEALDHIFDPFYTTKHESAEREGTGLGLAIAHQIVRDHRGYLDVSSQPGIGTTFRVNLPVHPPSQAPGPGIERRRPTRDP
jgi:signal transduction histidine kinase